MALGDVRARRDHGRELTLGFAKISARPRHYAQNELAVEAFKSIEDPGEAPERRRDRAVVARKPASAISSHADGPDVARARGHPATSAPNGPISSANAHALRHRPWRRTSSSAAVDPGAQAVLIVDQAGWHLTPKLATPTTSPSGAEIARVEPGGECLASRLSNRIFKSYEDIVALCRLELIDQPWKIMSLGMRKWAGF